MDANYSEKVESTVCFIMRPIIEPQLFRDRETDDFLARKICRDFGVPEPGKGRRVVVSHGFHS